MAALQSESDVPVMEEGGSSTPETRKRRRDVAFDNYMEGKSRKAYRLHQDIAEAQEDMTSPPNVSVKVCSSCSQPLSRIKQMFSGLKRQGSDLRKRRRSVPEVGDTAETSGSEQLRYRNLVLQNEWLRGNIFDTMGNYLFCQECVCAALQISKQRLSRQRNVKRKQYQTPVTSMPKEKVVAERLEPFVVMPEDQDCAFAKWWERIPADHDVHVRYLYERHGNAGKVSNNAKTQIHDDFLQFVELNSQPNGCSADSHGATHFFLAKFTTIRMPSSGAANYEEKLASSLVGEFNCTQQERGRGGCSDGSAWNWLKKDKPKYTLYPHKSDYCEFCAHKHVEINRQKTTLNRIRQTGSCSEEDQKAIEEEIIRLEDLLKKHKAEATSSLKHYHEVTKRCQTQWEKIVELENKGERTESEEQELRGLRDGFILVLSADYQMGNCCLPGASLPSLAPPTTFKNYPVIFSA